MQSTTQILKNLNVLYAEDNDQIRESTAKTLSILFQNVYTAKDGVDALKLYNSHVIHIALLDYVMPCIDGYELAKEIRNTNSKIPIIICSGYSDKEKLMHAIELGTISYLMKPLQYSELIKSLEKAVETLDYENLLFIDLGDGLVYDSINKTIIHQDIPITLTKQESLFLELLISKRKSLVLVSTIFDRVFDDETTDLNTLRNLVYRLRKKINITSITTVKELGYLLT